MQVFLKVLWSTPRNVLYLSPRAESPTRTPFLQNAHVSQLKLPNRALRKTYTFGSLMSNWLVFACLRKFSITSPRGGSVIPELPCCTCDNCLRAPHRNIPPQTHTYMHVHTSTNVRVVHDFESSDRTATSSLQTRCSLMRISILTLERTKGRT